MTFAADGAAHTLYEVGRIQILECTENAYDEQKVWTGRPVLREAEKGPAGT